MDKDCHHGEDYVECLEKGIISDAYRGSVEDIEDVEVRRDPEADCVYCPGGATLYRKSIKKNGDTRYCNKKLCRQCPYKDKCVTSAKYP